MTTLEYTLFDTDNHYYEPMDAFSRHIDPAFSERALRWATIDGRVRLIAGGRVNAYMPNPTFNPVSRPGWLSEYFRGADPNRMKEVLGQLDTLESKPEYTDRDARLKVMDEQGVAAGFFFPTLAVGMERALSHDPDALMAAFRAFNRWVHEDWGFNYRDRIFAAPLISLVDPDYAVEELEYALDNDVRIVATTYGPIVARDGFHSPSDRIYDRFWNMVNDAGVTIAFHGGETRYDDYLYDWGKRADVNVVSAARKRMLATDEEAAVRNDHLFRYLVSPSPIADTLAELISARMFHRFPKLRIAAIETGSAWLAPLMDRLSGSFRRTPQEWIEDPEETLRRHVWVAAFGEDDLGSLRSLLGGAEHVLVGSDWPHPEGYAHPADVLDDLRHYDFDDDECRTVVRDNGYRLATRVG